MPAIPKQIVTEGLNSGDIAWMLVATAFVLLMTPGLAYFYGGMVNHKNVISTMLQSFIAMGVISIVWVVVGFSLAFGDSIGGWVGNPMTFFMFNGVLDGKPWSLAPTIPLALFAFFQLKFAVITPALVTGSLAERIKFRSYILFMVLFSIFVYAPLAHWTWHPDGFLFKLGVLDFAGGTVVHMSAGWAALAGAIYLKRRRAHVEANFLPPANIPYVLLGTGLLWFGWFGFNAGSALEANGTAALAFFNTLVATAAAVLGWTLAEWITKGKPSMLGGASGCVAGLVAITPAAGFVGPMGAIMIGFIAGVVCLWGVSGLKRMLGADDSFDVFGVHGVGGIIGAILTGVFADPALGGSGIWDYVANAASAEYSMGSQVWLQAQGVITTVIWSGVVSVVAFKLVDIVIGLRVKEEEEREGLDIASHGETAYES